MWIVRLFHDSYDLVVSEDKAKDFARKGHDVYFVSGTERARFEVPPQGGDSDGSR
jgi:hypothetical protein